MTIQVIETIDTMETIKITTVVTMETVQVTTVDIMVTMVITATKEITVKAIVLRNNRG